ncbi:IS5 family transposase [Candidatus Parcubacteria bacterium]|nr:IS5 family transposase [Candidatus Parcubacteria bacterium]
MPKNKNKQSKQADKKNKSNKKKYKVRNWSEYNESLKKRGMIDVYIDEYAIEQWDAKPNNKRGAQPVYSDLAIQITLQFGKIFRQKLRQTEGLVISLFKLMDIDLNVPDFSTLSRRSENIEINIPKNNNKENIVVAVDSSGLKVFGEGEWKVRKHGWSKHRTWRKMHLMVTPDGEIRAADLTENNITDADVVDDLFQQESADIDAFAGDGAYDKKKVYNACKKKEIKRILVPPQKNAKIIQHGNSKLLPHPRDENLREIKKTSRKKWKEKCGYHVRSLSETAMFRFKTIFGDKLNSRELNRQKTEFLISVSILNKMTGFGMPNSYAVT